MQVQETYTPKRMAASGVLLGTTGGQIGGFLCATAGTVKLDASTDGLGTTIVDAVTVVSGQFVPMPFTFPPGGAGVYATLAGGCVGTFALM